MVVLLLVADLRLRVGGPVAGKKVLSAGQGEAVVGGDFQHPVLPDVVDGQQKLVVGIGDFIKMLKQKIGLSGGLHARGVAVEQRKAQLFCDMYRFLLAFVMLRSL